MKKKTPPNFESLNEYYKSYWKYLDADDVLQALKLQGESHSSLLLSLVNGEENYSYAEGKWKLKEVIGHLCDSERILSYRALRCSRNDKTSMHGFDENSFVSQSNFGSRSLNEIVAEWKSVRAATISLCASMTDELADRKGLANGVEVTARILFYFILVHEKHHLQIIKERYLSKAFSN